MAISYRNHNVYPKSIYIRDFVGKVDVWEIIDSWEFLLNSNLINQDTKGIINNLTDCELEMNMDSFKTLMVYLNQHQELKNIKLAVLSGDPRIIVFPTLGETTERDLKIRPFTTEAAAITWIIEEA